ncbi:MAG: argininosuccinate synthase [Dehalococcoidales bacterium]|nr:argininosuccinate synthase [Dehalococcoidales bacterium]
MAEKLVLAYSGGLDTSVAVRWLQEKYGYDVIAVTIDVGNEKDFTVIKDKALKVGAIKSLVIDARKEFVNDYIFPALKANALYEEYYPLATALARPLIAKILVDVARAEGAKAIAHGCTGKGNDQVRFDVGINSLAPDLKIVAPAREWGMTREELIQYAAKYGIPLPITSRSPYSIDENLWGKSTECGVLEDPWNEPPEDACSWTKSLKEAPEEPEYLEIHFEQGIPQSINGQKMDGITLIKQLNEIAGNHGIGRIDMIENRLVGIKSRETYEAPAAHVLIAAHKALESLTLAKAQYRFKNMVASEFSNLVYEGLWFTAHREDLCAYIDSTQRFVSGDVRVKLNKGHCTVVGRRSAYSLYSHNLATYAEGDEFDQSAAVGFIKLWGLPAKIQGQIQKEK